MEVDGRVEMGLIFLMGVVCDRWIDIINYLVENGVDVNVRKNDESILLFLVCYYDYIDFVECFFKYGVNVNF